MSNIKSLAAIIGAMGAGMSGYAKGRAVHQENARRKVLDAREDADYERKQKKQAQADEVEAGFKATQADQVVENVPSYDITRMDGGNPEQQPIVAYKASGQVFNDQAGAQQALLGVNSRAAKAERGAAYLQSQGQIEQAEKMYGFAKKAFDEGADEVITSVLAAAPKVEELKKAGGKVSGKVGERAAQAFNTKGGWKVSADTMVEYFADKNAAGQEFTNARILGKDGKPVVEDAYNAGRMLMSVKERYAIDKDNAAVYQQGQQIAETGRHNKTVEGLTAKRDAASIASSAADRSIQLRRLKLEENSFKRQTPEGQIAEIERITEVKLTPEEKKVFLGIKPGKGGADKASEVGAKLVADAVLEYQKQNMNVTPAQLATFKADLEAKVGMARENVQVESTLKTEFAGLKPDSAEYAAKWEQAKQLGLDDKDLTARGYKPPAKVVPNPFQQAAAQVGAAPSRPAAPARAPAQPFRPSLRTTPEEIAAREQAAAQQQRAAQVQAIAIEIRRMEQVLASGEGDPTFRAQAQQRLAVRKQQLAKMQGQ